MVMRSFAHHPNQSGNPLTVYHPPADEINTTRWRINGYLATIVIWTAEEWERLAERPPDAQYVSCGIWCALRMDG